MSSEIDTTVAAVRAYWDRNTLGLQYVSDPTLTPGSKEFFDHIRPWMNPYKFPWIMERIDREAASLKGKHLLEIGCGMGFDSLEFLKRGVRVTAIDLTESAVRMTRAHFEVAGVKAEDVRVGNALALDFPDESFDAVWSNGVLHATGDTPKAIAEVRRVLKPGGRAIISHFYRRPSWMYLIHRLGREPIEAHEEDPPSTSSTRSRRSWRCSRASASWRRRANTIARFPWPSGASRPICIAGVSSPCTTCCQNASHCTGPTSSPSPRSRNNAHRDHAPDAG
jgi:SAM-dependent methyltransferase